MGDKHRALGHLHDALGNFVKAGCRLNIAFADSGEFLNKGRNGHVGPDQRNELVHNSAAVKHKNGDLNYALLSRRASGCFEIYYCVHN